MGLETGCKRRFVSVDYPGEGCKLVIGFIHNRTILKRAFAFEAKCPIVIGRCAVSMRITFDGSARDFVLDAFGKKVCNGFIVEKSGQKVLTPRGEEIPAKEFAGVRKGSVVFLKSDIVSLVEAAEAIGVKPIA
jgi:hypothetical protein